MKAGFTKHVPHVIALLAAGCASLQSTHQAKLDQTQLREVLMDYVEDQILDNLIRAKNGRPIMQFDFAHVTANVTSKIAPTTTGGATLTSNDFTTTRTTTAGNLVTTVVGATGNMLHSIASPFSASMAVERDNVITIDASPVLNDKTVYAAYLTFLDASEDSAASPEPSKAETKFSVSKKTKTYKGDVSQKPESTVTVEAPEPEPTPNIFDKFDLNSSGRANAENPNAGSLRWSQRPPPPSSHVLFGGKQWRGDKNYYWIPTEYKKAFFRLCLAVVARGGAPGAPSSSASLEKKIEYSDFRSRQLESQPNK